MNIPKIWSRKNSILLKELVKTDFKIRYQGSVLGYLWAVLRPMLLFAILYTVFAFFSECTSQGIQAIVGRSDLLRKISFPKWIIVVSSTITALINFLINLCVIIVFALLNGVTPSFTWLLAPLVILELYLLSLGIAFFLGSINVKYRDISSIWEVLMQALFYAVPIIYPITMVSASSVVAAKVLLLNPIAQVIQDARYLLITNQSITVWNFIDNIFLRFLPVLITLFILTIGSIYFRKHSKYFAEEA